METSDYIEARIVNTPDEGTGVGDLITGSIPERGEPISKADYDKSLKALVRKLEATGAQVQVFEGINFPYRA